MKHNLLYTSMAVLLSAMVLLTACGQAATPTQAPPPTAEPVAAATTAPTQPPTVAATVAPTTAPTESGPCLIVGALYGGPINDAGYNQAMHESMAVMAKNIPCVKLIEAENVPDEAGAKTTMQNMMNEGAKLIFATASTHQNPMVDLAKTNPTVTFDPATSSRPTIASPSLSA